MNFSIIDEQNNLTVEGVQDDFLSGVESPTVIKVVGCGGAGGNAVTTMVKSNIKNVEFIMNNAVEYNDTIIVKKIVAFL